MKIMIKELKRITKKLKAIDSLTITFEVIDRVTVITGLSRTCRVISKLTSTCEDIPATTFNLKEFLPLLKSGTTLDFNGQVFTVDGIEVTLTKIEDIPTIDTQTELLGSYISIGQACTNALSCIAKDSPRNYANVAHFDLKGDTLNVVATDGFMLITTKVGDYSYKEDDSFSLPYPAIKVLSLDDQNSLTLFQNDDYVVFEGETEIYYLRKSHMKYPNYRAVLPKPAPTVDINRTNFINTLEILLVKSVKHRVTFSSIGAELHIGNGLSTVRVPTTSINTKDIIVNGQFLLQTLKLHKKTKLFRLGLPSDNGPITVSSNNSTTILMPVKG